MSSGKKNLHLVVEFGGGAELLFNKVKKHSIDLPDQTEPWTIKHLLVWLKDNLLTERAELFIQGDTVCKCYVVGVEQVKMTVMQILNTCEERVHQLVSNKYLSDLLWQWLVQEPPFRLDTFWTSSILDPTSVLTCHMRPGILVLVNESDWELLGQLDYKLQDNDNVLFISTLHGG